MTLPYLPPWQSVEEVAGNIGFSRRAILYWVERGEFPEPRKVRGKLRWRWSEVDAWMARSGKIHQRPTQRLAMVSRGKGRSAPQVYEGSFYDLCQRFMESEKFKGFAEGTQALWRRELAFACAPTVSDILASQKFDPRSCRDT